MYVGHSTLASSPGYNVRQNSREAEAVSAKASSQGTPMNANVSAARVGGSQARLPTPASSSMGQHRISIHVKVEENSASSTEESNGSGNNECCPTSAPTNLGWPGACIYRCNITADSRRYPYNGAESQKCEEEPNGNKREIDADNGSNHLLTLRDRFLCPGSAFSANISPSSSSTQPPPYQSQNITENTNCSKPVATSESLMSEEMGANAQRLGSNPRNNNNNTTSGSNRGINAVDMLVSAPEDKRRSKVPADPLSWDNEHVRMWLEWTIREYSLHDVDVTQFTRFLGRDLSRLSREDFGRLTTPYNGEILFNHLQYFRQCSSLNLLKDKSISLSTDSTSASNNEATPEKGAQQVTNPSDLSTSWSSSLRGSVKSESSYKGAWSSPATSPAQGYHHNAITGMTKPSALEPHTHAHLRNMQDPYQLFGPTSNRLASSGSGQIQLWQFLLELLSDSSNSNCITWEGTNGEFKLTDPDEVARRWGERKSKPNMNYDKLSRALRYYYDKNIMTKVHGKRYAYKFDFQGLAQATQPAAADPAAYKAAYQSADLFMHPPPGYPHPSPAAKLNFAAAVHSAAGIAPSSGTGSIFPSPTSYWTSPGAAANLYSNIAAASAGHHTPMSHHHPSHVASHIGSYPHYA